MKTFTLKPLALILILGIGFAACSKKGDTPALTKENLVGTYVMTSFVGKADGFPEFDLTANMDDCQKDDKYQLNADDTYNYLDAGTACAPDGSYVGDWALSGTTLTIDGDAATVSKFDGKVLVLTRDEEDPDTHVMVHITLTLTKQ